jgi:glycosyltransferase involved in cell wall biosynthesis
MKIFHLIDSGGLYGAEMMLVALAVEQKKLGFFPVIGSIRKKGIIEKPIEQEAIKRGIAVMTFDMRPGPNILGIATVLRHARENHFDILHSHGYKTNILLGLLPGFLRGIPMVTTLHGWTSTTGWTKMRLNEALDAFSIRMVDRVVLVNRGMLANSRIRKLPKNKLAIIDNGIDLDWIGQGYKDTQDSEMDSKIKAFCSRGQIVASIGRMSKEKGYHHLIDAVALLRKEYGADARLLLIGEGRLRQHLEQLARQTGLSDNFMITGYIKNAPKLLQYVDCYVISSLTEGLPITLLEVMASKTPVVATSVGGIPHVVIDHKDALLVPPSDPSAIARAVFSLLTDQQLCKRMVSSARQKVLQQYSSKAMAEKYIKIYQSVTSKINRNRPAVVRSGR